MHQFNSMHPAPNANHQKQNRFFSTKKKRPSNKRWAKPTLTEKEQCLAILNKVEDTFCAICSREDDTNDGENFVCWIQCTECGVWVHKSCSGLLDTDYDYFCKKLS